MSGEVRDPNSHSWLPKRTVFGIRDVVWRGRGLLGSDGGQLLKERMRCVGVMATDNNTGFLQFLLAVTSVELL